MSRFFLVIAGIIGLAFGGAFVSVGSAWFHGKGERSQLERIMPEVVRRWSAKLPQKVDEVTTLNGLSSNGVRLTYTYLVDTNRFRIGDVKQWKQNLKTKTAQRLCADATVRRFFAAGAVMEQRYFDLQSREIGSFDVIKADC